MLRRLPVLGQRSPVPAPPMRQSELTPRAIWAMRETAVSGRGEGTVAFATAAARSLLAAAKGACECQASGSLPCLHKVAARSSAPQGAPTCSRRFACYLRVRITAVSLRVIDLRSSRAVQLHKKEHAQIVNGISTVLRDDCLPSMRETRSG